MKMLVIYSEFDCIGEPLGIAMVVSHIRELSNHFQSD